MKVDAYTKALLTVIAACLVILTLQNTSLLSQAHAAGRTICEGELKANAWGGVREMIGGYKVSITCE